MDPRYPTQIAKGLWVGDMNAAKDAQFLKSNNIKRIINCTPDVPFYYPDVIRYMRIPLGDSRSYIDNETMKSHLSEAINFIKFPEPSSTNAVLVHCHVGVSRSCTVIAAYLRSTLAQSVPHAVALVLAKRPAAFFNGKHLNFKKALTEYFGH